MHSFTHRHGQRSSETSHTASLIRFPGTIGRNHPRPISHFNPTYEAAEDDAKIDLGVKYDNDYDFEY